MMNNKSIDTKAILAGVLLYMLAPLGITLIPLFVGSVQSELDLTDSQVGYLASIDLLGIALASATAIFWLKKIAWRYAALIGLLIIIVGSLVSLSADSFIRLACFRFITEVGSGMLFSLAMAVLGLSAKPDRYISIGVGLTIALAVLLFVLLPNYIDQYGSSAIYCLHIILTFLLLPCCALLPSTKLCSDKGQSQMAPVSYIGLCFCLTALFCFSIVEGSVWAYFERIGESVNLSAQYVGHVLALTQVVSFVAAVLASMISTRFGRTWPIVVCVILFLSGVYLLVEPDANIYMLAACLTQAAYIYMIPYLMLMCVEYDFSSRFYVLAIPVHLVGFAVGPSVVAWFLESSKSAGLTVIYGVSVVFLIMTLVLIFPWSLKLDRSS